MKTILFRKTKRLIKKAVIDLNTYSILSSIEHVKDFHDK